MTDLILKRGILIVLDGIDGTGKTTQAKKLLKTLKKKGYDAVYFREPSDSKWGREIKRKAALADSLSPAQELDLFQRDRLENVEKNLKPALEQNKIIVLDRYYYSTIAYQGARGIDPLRIQKMNEKFAVKPDLAFILDVTPRVGLRRIEKTRREKDLLFEQEDYLGKVRKIFKSFRGKNIFQIDAFRSEEDIYREIEETVCGFLRDLRHS
jgi:dTMP kinase